MRSFVALAVFLISVTGVAAPPATPVQWSNCGRAGDLLSISALNADRVSPGLKGPAFPIAVRAELSAKTAQLRNLEVTFRPQNWTFELKGPFSSFNVDGFIALPDDWLSKGSPAMTLVTPQSIAAGPLNESGVFPPIDSTGQPLTGAIHATVAQNIPASTAKIMVSFNGMSGFPYPPEAGQYKIRFEQFAEEPGATLAVACMELSLKDRPIVTVKPVAFRVFDSIRQRGGRLLGFQYGPKETPIPSNAIDPALTYKKCGASATPGHAPKGKLRYDAVNHTWTFAWDVSSVTPGCYEFTVQSRLTGQLDGPFELEVP